MAIFADMPMLWAVEDARAGGYSVLYQLSSGLLSLSYSHSAAAHPSLYMVRGNLRLLPRNSGPAKAGQSAGS